MAPKGTKRPCQQKNAEAKKIKVEVCPMLTAVCAVVEGADLPDTCRDMLLASIPASFSHYASERHAIQRLMVEMVGEVVVAAEERFQQHVCDAGTVVTDFESVHSGLNTNIDEAVRCHETTRQELESRNDALGRASAGEDSARKVLESVQESSNAGEVSAASAAKDLEMLRKAIEVDLPALTQVDEGAVLPTDDTVRCTVAPLLRLVDLDKSLVIALPSACTKKQSDRGAFDKMVIDQLMDTAGSKASELAARVEQETLACKEGTASVETARAAFAAKVEEHSAASQEVLSAQQQLSEHEAAVTLAREAVAAHLPSLNVAKATLQDKDAELQNFREYNLKSFNQLRDKEKLAETDATQVDQTVRDAAASGGELTVTDSVKDNVPQEDVALSLPKVLEVEQCNMADVSVGGA